MNNKKRLLYFKDGDLTDEGSAYVKDFSTYHSFTNDLSINGSNVRTDNDTFFICVRNTENRVNTVSGTDIFVDANKLSRSDLGLFVFDQHDIIDSGGSPLTVSKEVDTVSVDALEFGATEGMIVFDFDSMGGGTRFLMSMGSTTNDRFIVFRSGISIKTMHIVGGVSSGVTAITGLGADDPVKIALGWDGNYLKTCVNGGVVKSYLTADGLQFTPLTPFTVGANQSGFSQLNSVVRSLITLDHYTDNEAIRLTT